ncbi:MAG: efflux RND transporter periplasmic adaptor subunit [Myxococcales bacterium]|nr:efflux RND transporter periplasmic adaptor subunit [Myxococcales bacterium]
MLSRLLFVALSLVGCTEAAVCPDPRAAGPASAASGWAAVEVPNDLTLLQAPGRAILGGDREAVLQPIFRAQIVRFHVRPGDRVRAGQAVVEVIMPSVADAAAVYRGATRRRSVQGTRRDKLSRLRGEGLVSEGAIFEVASLTAESEQQVLVAAATLRAAGVDPARAGELVAQPTITIKSPIDGVVQGLGGRIGEVVEGAGAAMATIVGEGRPRVEARFLHEPPAGARLRFAAVDGTTWPLVPVPIGRVVEADDGAVTLWFDVAEERLAFAGLRGTVEVESDDPAVLQVPAGALRGQGEALVVVRRRGDEVREVAVALLASSGATALVRAREDGALIAGDRVADDARALERSGGAM